jgi:DNA-binding transcriptional LysR family regulator
MKFQQLAAFATVAKHMNISLSKHLQALEHDYKTKLFKHRPLSSCGEAFLKLLRRWCEEKRNKEGKIKPWGKAAELG